MVASDVAPVPLGVLNEMSRDDFVAIVGPVFEHTPQIAADAWTRRPFASVAALVATMREIVEQFDDTRRVELLRAHPELGARRPMAALSVDEQRGAGLHDIDTSTADDLAALNANYRRRFGFPFIIAVRGRGPDEVVAALRERLDNGAAVERRTAIAEVLQIATMRLEALIADVDGASPSP